MNKSNNIQMNKQNLYQKSLKYELFTKFHIRKKITLHRVKEQI